VIYSSETGTVQDLGEKGGIFFKELLSVGKKRQVCIKTDILLTFILLTSIFLGNLNSLVSTFQSEMNF